MDFQKWTFPKDFKWAVATAAHQIEGGWNQDGKGPSIWNTFDHLEKSRIRDKSTGDVACDSYNNIEADVTMMAELGLSMYRFSFAWSRLLPAGTVDRVNAAGVDYYKRLINALLAKGIEPMVTLYHWDLPQALQDRGGFLNAEIVDWFVDYATFCFETFGDQVKYWITWNEPYVHTWYGHGRAWMAPGLPPDHSSWVVYLVGHRMLLAHGNVYRLYRQRFHAKQKGLISIALNSRWAEPHNRDDPRDVAAAEKVRAFELGWFANPIFSADGDYPPVMKECVARKSKEESRVVSRLPEFTAEQREMIRGSADFFSLNNYTTCLVSHDTSLEPILQAWNPFRRDMGDVLDFYDPTWKPVGKPTSWCLDVPWGLRRLLGAIKKNYGDPLIFISENGCPNDEHYRLDDPDRIHYLRGFIQAVRDAIYTDGCRVFGYALWSLLDNYEWAEGYTYRFGLYAVDFDHPRRPRTAKTSARWYRALIDKSKL